MRLWIGRCRCVCVYSFHPLPWKQVTGNQNRKEGVGEAFNFVADFVAILSGIQKEITCVKGIFCSTSSHDSEGAKEKDGKEKKKLAYLFPMKCRKAMLRKWGKVLKISRLFPFRRLFYFIDVTCGNIHRLLKIEIWWKMTSERCLESGMLPPSKKVSSISLPPHPYAVYGAY